MSVKVDECLQCGKSRAQVRDWFDSLCATAEGYETVETLDEWPRHHWSDWSDTELTRNGILPRAFEKHRRSSIYDLPYAACADTVRGHNPTVKSFPEFGIAKGQCWDCGQIPALT